MAPFSFLAFFAALLQGEALELSGLDDNFFETMGDEALDLPQLRAAALYQLTAARLARQSPTEADQPIQDAPHDELGKQQVLDWSYNDPEAWTSTHADCGGHSQSPVAFSSVVLQANDNASLASLLDYTDIAGLSAVNSGTAIEVEGGFGTFKLPDGDYDAVQFHFHFPAEHSIDGRLTDGELHIVHRKHGSTNLPDAPLAVIGVLLTVRDDETAQAKDDAYPLLDQLGFLSGLPRESEQAPIKGAINLRRALERELVGTYYHYQGSLSTPPCSESVHWYVLAEPASITQRMVDNFKDFFPDPMNNRPLQPLNDRIISASLQTDLDEFGILAQAVAGQ